MNPEPAPTDQPSADDATPHVAGQTFLPGSPLPSAAAPSPTPTDPASVTPPTPAADFAPLAPMPDVPAEQEAMPETDSSASAPLDTAAMATAPEPPSATGGATVIMPASGRPRRSGIVPTIIGVALVVLLGAGVGYAYTIGPKTALRDYLLTVSSAKTAKFSLLAGSTSDDYNSSITANGSYDIRDINAPKADIVLKGTYTPEGSAAAASGAKAASAGGELIYLDKTIYVKVDTADLITQYLNVDVTKDWYKYSATDQTETVKKCIPTSSKKSGNLFGGQILTDLPLKNQKRHGLFEVVNGHYTQHFSGELDLGKLQKAIDLANKDLSSDCQISFKASELAGQTYSYDLWRGWDFDRFKVGVRETKSTGTLDLTLDTSAYNKPVTITAPSNAKSLEDLIKNIFSGTDTNGSTVDSVEARDAQRKSDLRAVRSALESYFNDKDNYPAGNYAGLSKYLVPGYMPSLPTDPTGSGNSYLYIPTCKKAVCAHYQLRATLENTKDAQITIPPAIFSLLSLN